MDNFKSAKKSTEDAWDRHAKAFYSIRESLDNAADKIEKGFSDLKVKQDLLAKENDGADVKEEDLLEINAGGKIVTATRKIFTQLRGTRLEALFSGRWERQLQRDRDERIFLDVNASCFQSIVDYLGELEISPPDDPPDPPHVDEEHAIFLERLLRVLGIDQELGVPIDSVILTEGEYEGQLYELLDEDNIGGNLELLYRGSRDGFGASKFHKKCDNKGRTVTVVKTTEGFVFGGFTATPWSCDEEYAVSESEKPFLFALKSYRGLGPIKMRSKSDGLEVFHGENYGPVFGCGHDLFISSESNINNYSYSQIESCYFIPPGETDVHFLTGSKNFTVSEIEVFCFGTTNRYLICNDKNENVSLENEILKLKELSTDDFPVEIKTAVDEEKESLIASKDVLQKQIRAFELEKHFIDTFVKGETKDIIHFNVGGEIMAVKRSTLGRFPNSVLAKRFNDPLWKHNESCQSFQNFDYKQVAKWASEEKSVPNDVTEKLHNNKIGGAELLLFGRDDLKEICITRPGTLAIMISIIDRLRKGTQSNIIVVNQSAYCFGKIIDQLRMCAMCQPGDEMPPGPEIHEPDKKRYKRIVEYYFPGDEAISVILGNSQ